MLVHAFIFKIQEAETGGSLSLRPAWFAQSQFQDSHSCTKKPCLRRGRRKRKKNQSWWPKPVIPIQERWRPGDSELEDSLGYKQDPVENEKTEIGRGEHRDEVLIQEEGLFRWRGLWEKTSQQRWKARAGAM